MGIVVLLFFLLGVAALAYGLSLVYYPLLPITLGTFALGAAFILSRSRAPR